MKIKSVITFAMCMALCVPLASCSTVGSQSSAPYSSVDVPVPTIDAGAQIIKTGFISAQANDFQAVFRDPFKSEKLTDYLWNGTQVNVYEEKDGYYLVEANGIVGYIPTESLSEINPAEETKEDTKAFIEKREDGYYVTVEGTLPKYDIDVYWHEETEDGNSHSKSIADVTDKETMVMEISDSISDVTAAITPYDENGTPGDMIGCTEK